MEYLEGESVASLLRRLRIRGRKLHPALAAHIVAEACSGLQAAHELRDTDGNLQDLVHRDICPSNLFVTYDGAAKILDFGIAKAAHRITRTEAGMLKGKFAYMSPEQCRGETLDRRSDVFSLGVVFYEMLTGRRLFGRDSKLKTLTGVTSDPIPRPSQVDPDCPVALDAVCMRALSRDLDERYGQALDMRRDIAKAMRALDGPDLPEMALSELMRELFADRMDEKQEMLRGVREGSRLAAIPAAEVDVEVELPSIDPTQFGSLLQDSTLRSEGVPRRGRFLLAALALTVVVGVGLGVALGETGAPPPSSAPRTASAPEPVDHARGPEARAAPHSDQVELKIDSEPSGATVEIDGAPRGLTPLAIRLDRDMAEHEVRLTRQGSATAVRTLVLDRDLAIFMSLVDEAPVPEPRTKRPRRHRRNRTRIGMTPPDRPATKMVTKGFYPLPG
jgi:serine/threonine-protein kinase